MNDLEIITLIEKGETGSVEFKKSLSEIDKAIKTLAAFANGTGGVVLMGVNDKGKVFGVDAKNGILKKISNKIINNLDPKQYPTIETVNVGGKNILVMEIDEAFDKPVYAFGKSYKRMGSSIVKVDNVEIRKDIAESLSSSFDTSICKNARFEDLDIDKIKWFLDQRRIQLKKTMKKDLGFMQILLNLNMIGDNSTIKNAAILMFGKEPYKFFMQCAVRMARFKGTRRTKILDQKEFRDILPYNIENAVKFLEQYIPEMLNMENRMFREQKLLYDLDAIKEAITNAVIHRDYTCQTDIQIAMFDDRIQIMNPGGFVKKINLNNPYHVSRNELICQSFFECGFIEKWGYGLPLMLKDTKQKGYPPAEINSNDDMTTVTFKKLQV